MNIDDITQTVDIVEAKRLAAENLTTRAVIYCTMRQKWAILIIARDCYKVRSARREMRLFANVEAAIKVLLPLKLHETSINYTNYKPQ